MPADNFRNRGTRRFLIISWENISVDDQLVFHSILFTSFFGVVNLTIFRSRDIPEVKRRSHLAIFLLNIFHLDSFLAVAKK